MMGTGYSGFSTTATQQPLQSSLDKNETSFILWFGTNTYVIKY